MRSAQPIPAPRTLTLLPSSGPLSELHYPIDSLTKKPKGFAFVTFMFPEHAVKAYAAVDGQVFQVTAQGWRGAAGPRGSGNDGGHGSSCLAHVPLAMADGPTHTPNVASTHLSKHRLAPCW